MASVEEISAWFDEGVALGETHMIVVCDTFDFEDFALYASGTADEVRKRATEEGEKPLQRVMEVYNLSMDKDAQLSQHRAFNY